MVALGRIWGCGEKGFLEEALSDSRSKYNEDGFQAQNGMGTGVGCTGKRIMEEEAFMQNKSSMAMGGAFQELKVTQYAETPHTGGERRGIKRGGPKCASNCEKARFT